MNIERYFNLIHSGMDDICSRYKPGEGKSNWSLLRNYSLAIVLSLFLSSCNFTLAADVTPPAGYQQEPVVVAPAESTTGPLYPLIPPDPSAGASIYAEKCAPCHGTSGLGNGVKAKDLPNPVTAIGSPEIARNSTPGQWFKIVTQGNLERFMPPFASLTDRQRWDVIAYTYRLSNTDQSNANSQAIYAENCAQCHGDRGEGDGPLADNLKMPDFTRQEYMASRSEADFFAAISEGISPNMAAFADKLSEEERWDMSGYIRSLSFAVALATENQKTPDPDQEPVIAQISPVSATEPSQAASSNGLVTGIIMNASGGAIPEGSEVMLHAFDQMELVYTATTNILADGTYAFDGIELEPGRSFLSTVNYDGAVYSSEFVTGDAANNKIELPIQVYDTTDDASVLTVDRLHFFFEFIDEKTVRVIELYVISNPTKLTVRARVVGQPVLTFSLPAQASNIEFEDGELGGRYLKTENGFGDTVPVRPGAGEYQVLVAYQMPYDKKLELSRPMSMETKAVVILVPEESIKVKGEGIEDAGSRDVQGTQYHMYSGKSLPKGSELSLTVTGRPTGAGPAVSVTSNSNLIVGLGALGIVLILAGVWLYRRNNPGEEPENDASDEVIAENESAESVMDAILALDDLFQEGQLPEEAYLQRRGELKARLKKLMT